MFHGLAEGIWLYKLNKINAHPKGNWYCLVQKKIDQQTVYGSQSYSKTGTNGDKKVKTGRGVRHGCCLSWITFKLYSEYLTKDPVEGFGDFKIRVQVIRTVKYADDFMLLAEEEKVLQGMIHWLTEIGRCYGMEMNKKS